MNIDPNKIKEVHSTNDKQFVELIYGDSVTGDSLIKTNRGDIRIDELFEKGKLVKHNVLSTFQNKDYVDCEYWAFVSPTKLKKIKYIMRHWVEKDLYKITTKKGKRVTVTEDHSLMTPYGEATPKSLQIGSVICTLDGPEEILSITKKDCPNHVDQQHLKYVYDVCIETNKDEEHVFYANNILVHNTDSLYMSWENLLNTIEGSENWSPTQKTEFLVRLSSEFLNQHNKEFMTEYYRKRHARNVDTDMVHEFELETVALSGVWLNVKKRYAQLLTWKDGKYYDEDSLPLKTKGLEIVKSSYPKLARDILKDIMYTLLESNDSNLNHILNIKMQEAKQKWFNADIEETSPAISVNNYNKYVKNDTGEYGPECEKGTPFQVRGLAYYNWLRQTKNLPGNPLYGGKCKYYIVNTSSSKRKSSSETFFVFQPSEYPKWAPKYAPVDKPAMFKKCVLDPFNRILGAINMDLLRIDGAIQSSLFDDIFGV